MRLNILNIKKSNRAKLSRFVIYIEAISIICCGIFISFIVAALFINFFFLLGVSSQTLTIHRTAGEERGPSFIPLYHFHPLTNIETFICNFACEMTITYF